MTPPIGDAAAGGLPEDPRLVELLAHGESEKIVLPFPGSLGIRDGLFLIGGLVGLRVVRSSGDPQMAGLVWGLYSLAILGMISSTISQLGTWIQRRDAGYIPLALQGHPLIHTGASDCLLLTGVLLIGVPWQPAVFLGHGLVFTAVLIQWRLAQPVARRGIAAIESATRDARTSHWRRPPD